MFTEIQKAAMRALGRGDRQPGRDDKPQTKPKDQRDPKQPGPTKPA